MDFCNCRSGTEPADPPLAMACMPVQAWEVPYPPEKGLKQGTIFPGLDKPFYVLGGEDHG